MGKVYNIEGRNLAWFREKLENNVLRVTFRKADGTERIMDCTLKEDKFPASVPFVQGAGYAQPKDSISVVDVGLGAWRRFRIDSVTEVEQLEKAIA